MEVVTNQWDEAEEEVEEVGLQRRRGLQRSKTGTTSDEDVEGGGLEFDQSTMKQKFGVIRAEVNAEMILQHEDTGKSIILPASDSPIPGDPTSLNTVTTEIGTVGIVKENEREWQELYLERVFQKPPTDGFYCPNCNACIQNVVYYVQKGEWQQNSAPTPPPKPIDPIRCSSCFSFLLPIGGWLFPGLVSDDDGALNDQVTDSSSNTRLPEQKLKGLSQHKAPEPDQPVEVLQSVAQHTTKPDVNPENDSGNQTLQIIEEVVLLGPGPQKVASEVEDKINATGIGSIPGTNVKSQDSSNQFSVSSQEPKDPVAPRKKHFWSHWAAIGEASETSIPKQPETDSPKNSDWSVIIPVASQAPRPTQSEIGFSDNEQPELNAEVKADGRYTGPAEQVVPAERVPLLPRRKPAVVQEAASTKTSEILKSIVYGGLPESLASLGVVTSAASTDATTLNIVAMAIANLVGGLFVLGLNLVELKAEQPQRAENQTDATVDRYNELLGQRENFFFHAFIAIISFIVFGLVPPVVYGFSFRERDDKDFKLAAVASASLVSFRESDAKDLKLAAVVGASLLCVTLLFIAKAYIQRPKSYVVYFQKVLYYVSTRVVASMLSYLAGDLVKKLMEKLGWFESASNFALQVPVMSVQKPGWRSY